MAQTESSQGAGAQPNMEQAYQVVVIGAGPGGYVAAIKSAKLGLKTAIVEGKDIGGTCLNRGCIPTKTLAHTSDAYRNVQRASLFGIKAKSLSLDFDAIRARKESIVDTLREGVKKLLEAHGVQILTGFAQIVSPSEVRVSPADGGDALVLQTESIIIATGTSPQLPDIEGVQLPGVYTSDSILDELPFPKSMAIMGGGVTGMELAHIYNDFGTEVSVFVGSERPLRFLDRELGQSLAMEMKKKGIALTTKTVLRKIEAIPGQPDASLRVVYEYKDEERSIDVDAVLIAKGRRHKVSSVLAPEFECELACERGYILVDEHMRTSVPGIYAIGDIISTGPQLAHAASAEGVMAASAIAGVDCVRRLDIVPSCIYTSPEIAYVGMSESEAKKAGIKARSGKFPMAGNGKTLIEDSGRSFMKIVVDEDDRIIGAQLMCAHATDIIGELAVGIAAGLTVSEMLQVVRPHPTFEEAVGETLDMLAGGAIHSMPRMK